MCRVVILLFLSAASAQINYYKRCNFTELITSYNVSTIAGTWYQLERIGNDFDTGDCTTITFKIIFSGGNPTGLEFSSRAVAGGDLVYRNASASFNTSYIMGVLNFTFTDGGSYDFVLIPVPHYENESMVMYSCQNNGNRSSVWVWKLGKSLTQSPGAKNAVEKLLEGIEGLFFSFLSSFWRTTSFSETACHVNGGVNPLIISPFFILIVVSIPLI